MAASSSVVDLCRLCGTDTQNIVRHAIFEGEGRSKLYAKKISECLPLQVTEADQLPKIMCGECTYKLDMMSNFRDKAVKTEAMLVSLVEGVKPELPDDDDGLDNEVDTMDDDFRSSSPEPPEPEVLIKEEEPPQPEKRPGRKAANKRPIRESDDEEEEEAPVKKRGRKPKEPAAAAAAPPPAPKENTGPPPLVVRADDDRRLPLIGAPLFQCRYCKDLFESHKATRRHIWSEHRFQCRSCDFKGQDEEELKTHVQETHTCSENKENRPRCCVCLRGCTDREAYRAHLNLHLGCLPFECAFCDRVFADRKRLEKHVKRHVDPRPVNRQGPVPYAHGHHQCPECPKVFKRRDDLRLHIRNVHRHSCPCGKFFQSEDSLQDHRSKEHPDWIIPCRMCDKSFISPMLLAQHMDKFHEGQTYPCNNCTVVSRTMVAMLNHRTHRCRGKNKNKSKLKKSVSSNLAKMKMKSNLAKMALDSNLAKKIGSKLASMKAKISLPKPVPKTLLCDFCHGLLGDKTALETHIEAHLRKALLVKEASEKKALMAKEALEKKALLMKLALEKKAAFKTEAMTKRALKMEALKKETKTTNCHICSLNCPSRKLLLTHLDIHNNKKRAQCEICNYLAPTNAAFNEHMFRHEDTVAPLYCSVCLLNFRSSLWAAKHIGAYHNKTATVIEREGGVQLQDLPENDPTATDQLATLQQMCYLCKIAFSGLADLFDHMLMVHGETQDEEINCPVCGSVHVNMRSLLGHMRSGHKINQKWPTRCTFCSKVVLNLSYGRHLAKLHPECPYCQERQPTLTALVSHVSSKHPGMPDLQDVSNSRSENTENQSQAEIQVKEEVKMEPFQGLLKIKSEFKSEPGVSADIKTEPVESSQPSSSPKKPTAEPPQPSRSAKTRNAERPSVKKSGSSSKKHVAAGSPLKKPSESSPPFNNEAALSLLEKLGGNTSLPSTSSSPSVKYPFWPKKKPVCPICNLKLKTIAQLKFHQINVHFYCGECEVKYENREQLQAHISDHPKRLCPICDAELFAKGTMQRHVTRKHPHEPLCAVCVKLLGSMEELEAHYKGEHPELEKCELCSVYLMKYSMKTHIMAKHTDVAKLGCTYCQKSFKNKVTLNTHMRSHTGTKPYECPCCPESYTSINSLNQHFKIHNHPTNNGFMNCPWCDQMVDSVCDMSWHVKESESCKQKRDSQECVSSEAGKANGENGESSAVAD